MKNSVIWALTIVAISIMFTQFAIIINQQTNIQVLEADILNKQQAIKSLFLSIPAEEPDPENKPPPPGKTFDDGHWHGNYWHDTSK